MVKLFILIMERYGRIVMRIRPAGARVEVGLAPNDANYVYAIIESANQVAEIVYTPNALFWNSISEPDDSDGSHSFK